jgi:hypothetical protein
MRAPRKALGKTRARVFKVGQIVAFGFTYPS